MRAKAAKYLTSARCLSEFQGYLDDTIRVLRQLSSRVCQSVLDLRDTYCHWPPYTALDTATRRRDDIRLLLCCQSPQAESDSDADRDNTHPPGTMTSQPGTASQDGVQEGHVTRVLVMGPRGIGKTSLARTIADGAFPPADILTHTDETHTVQYKNTRKTAFKFGDCRDCYFIELKEVLRLDVNTSPKWNDIDGSHLIYLCFDITNPETFDAVRDFHFPGVTKELHGKKNTPQLILVGLKEDEKGNVPKGIQPITPTVANSLANEMGAIAYVETSSLKNIGIELIKEKTVFSHMENSKHHEQKMKDSRCSVL